MHGLVLLLVAFDSVLSLFEKFSQRLGLSLRGIQVFTYV